MLTRRSMLVIAALSGFTPTAQAQDYPAGPVTIVVSFPAGGSIDVVTRAIAPKLQERLGKPVVVENRVGGGGVIATNAVAKAAPDGLTLLASASSLAANPKLAKSLPFDTLGDLQSVSLVFRTPLALVMNPNLPVKSVPELIALLKQKPGEINYAHGGPGSAIHLAAELFKTMTGTNMNGVAYRGAPLGLNDVMAGHVRADVRRRRRGDRQYFRRQGARAWRHLDHARSRAAGHADHRGGRRARLRRGRLDADFGAEGDAAAGHRSAAAEFKAIAATPEIRGLIVRLGTVPVDSPSPAELQKFLASEIDRWGGIVERAGVAQSQ